LRGFFYSSSLQNSLEITYYNIRISTLFSALFRHFLVDSDCISCGTL